MSDQPIIEQRDNGPLVVKNVDTLQTADGKAADPKKVFALCRCGQSKNKPFCDGSHNDAEFDSRPADISAKDHIYDYAGQEANVHFSKLLCSHAGECGRRALAIFNPAQKPWVQPDNGSIDQIKDVIAACPSGALRMSMSDQTPVDVNSDDVSITVDRNGPYRVRNVPIDVPNWAKGQTPQKYVLCRCGKSGNKPFCDGTHYDQKWREDD